MDYKRNIKIDKSAFMINSNTGTTMGSDGP